MDIEVLISTMNQKDEKTAERLFENMHIKGKATMINQITDINIKSITKENGEKRIYSYYEKGLSKSRNIAMKKLKGDIGIFADDDVIYNANYQNIIKKAYKNYPDADIIAFYVASKTNDRPVRKQKTHHVNFITAMKIQSFQITFKKGITIEFDEKFGAGGKYNFGEENIWLYDCIKQGKKIYYINEQIGVVSHEKSTWYSEMNKNFLENEGAVLYRISKRYYIALILQYALRKRTQYIKNISTKNAIKYLFQGAKEYKNNKEDKKHSRKINKKYGM
mgnify:CR=1 FL=1